MGTKFVHPDYEKIKAIESWLKAAFNVEISGFAYDPKVDSAYFHVSRESNTRPAFAEKIHGYLLKDVDVKGDLVGFETNYVNQLYELVRLGKP